MKKIASYLILLFIPILMSLESCGGSCSCMKTFGCSTLSVVRFSHGDTLRGKVFCSVDDFYTDVIWHDSITAYHHKYDSDTCFVAKQDTVYSLSEIDKIRPQDTEHYTKQGYSCSCAN